MTTVAMIIVDGFGNQFDPGFFSYLGTVIFDVFLFSILTD